MGWQLGSIGEVAACVQERRAASLDACLSTAPARYTLQEEGAKAARAREQMASKLQALEARRSEVERSRDELKVGARGPGGSGACWTATGWTAHCRLPAPLKRVRASSLAALPSLPQAEAAGLERELQLARRQIDLERRKQEDMVRERER